jgi:hypothetical protein
MNDMFEAIEDFDEVEKLGQGFTSTDPLEEIDIGDGITPSLTYVNKNMSLEHKDAIIKLVNSVLIALSGIIVKCPDSVKSWYNIDLQLNMVLGLINNTLRGLIRSSTIGLRRR